MKSELRKRVETLESGKGVGEWLTSIVRTVIAPGAKGSEHCELRALVSVSSPFRLERRKGEDVPEFIRRAAKAAPSNGLIPRLMQEIA